MGTWPGNPPEVKPEAEPNWRSLFAEQKILADHYRAWYKEELALRIKTEKERDAFSDMLLEMGERD